MKYEPLLRDLQHPDPSTRVAALRTLRDLPDPDGALLVELDRACRDANRAIRTFAETVRDAVRARAAAAAAPAPGRVRQIGPPAPRRHPIASRARPVARPDAAADAPGEKLSWGLRIVLVLLVRMLVGNLWELTTYDRTEADFLIYDHFGLAPVWFALELTLLALVAITFFGLIERRREAWHAGALLCGLIAAGTLAMTLMQLADPAFVAEALTRVNAAKGRPPRAIPAPSAQFFLAINAAGLVLNAIWFAPLWLNRERIRRWPSFSSALPRRQTA